MNFKIVVFCLTIAAPILLAVLALFVSNHHHTSSKTTLRKKENTKFKTFDNGNRIANIPYEEYLNCEPVKNYETVCGLSQKDYKKNTSIIQKKIDEVSKNTGGTVLLPEGTYYLAPIELKSNVTLYIPKETTLICIDSDSFFSLEKSSNAFIYANGAKNVHILGGGTIDANGLTFTSKPKTDSPFYALEYFNLYQRVILSRARIRFAKKSEFVRPNILRLSCCENSSVEGIRLKDTPSWTCVISNCKNFTVKNLVIDNHLHIANGDGIDITGGSGISIEHCFVATPDDGICIKSTDSDVSDVKITDCTVCSFANCFKIGTETEFDIKNISVKDCYFFMPDGIVGGYSGIAVESADGANVSNVTVSNIEMEGISSPLLIWLGNRLKRGRDKAGSITDIKIENIAAKNAELPCAITGCKDAYIDGVSINNLKFTYRDTKENLSVKRHVSDHAMSDYPEITRVSHYYFRSHEKSKYWSLPCCGIYIRFADNIFIKNFSCTPRRVNKLNMTKIEKAQVDFDNYRQTTYF